jgi:DNA-binding MarR family transcriptional regulator
VSTTTSDESISQILSSLDSLRMYRMRSFCTQPLHREISLPQLHVLITLQERQAMTVSELANLLGISMPSASSIVDRMEERCLVTRTRDTVDRRVVTVEISPHGGQVAEEFMGLKREQVMRLFARMTDEELTHVVRGIEAITAALARNDEVPEKVLVPAGGE